jgi:hypothetical protein
MKDYSALYISSTLASLTLSTLVLASAIRGCTSEIRDYKGILTQDTEQLEQIVPGLETTNQVDYANILDPNSINTIEYPTQQVDNFKVLMGVLKEQNPDSEIYKLSDQIFNTLSQYQQMLEE